MQIVVNGLMTRYEKQGSAKDVLILLHGWGDTARSLGVMAKKMSEKYTVVRLDLPGFGQTQPPEDVWGLGDYSAFVKDFLEKIDIDDVYGVIGHSNGAALAIKSLAAGQLKPKKLVLMSAAGIRDTQNVRRQTIKLIAKIGKVATFWMPKSWRSKLQLKLYGAVGSDMFVAPHLKETFKKTVREDVQSDAKKLEASTLLIYGEKDRATPVKYGQTYNKLIKDSRLEIINNAGHFVHHDASEDVIKLVKDFLS